MSRLWVSILTLVIYGLAQFGVILLHMAGLFNNLSSKELVFANIYTQVGLFIIAAILIIIINNFISNPTRLEQQIKEKKRYVIVWAIVGYFVVMIYQILAGMINMYVFGAPQSSPNTERLMKVAQEIPLFIILISIVGPILEEFVFRKVIFGEIYNLINANKTIKFLIAAIVSSIIFSAAHASIIFYNLFWYGLHFCCIIRIYQTNLGSYLSAHDAKWICCHHTSTYWTRKDKRATRINIIHI